MKLKIVLTVAAVGAVTVVPAAAEPAQPELSGKVVEYSVLARDGVDVGVVEHAVRTAGGTGRAFSRSGNGSSATSPPVTAAEFSSFSTLRVLLVLLAGTADDVVQRHRTHSFHDPAPVR